MVAADQADVGHGAKLGEVMGVVGLHLVAQAARLHGQLVVGVRLDFAIVNVVDLARHRVIVRDSNILAAVLGPDADGLLVRRRERRAQIRHTLPGRVPPAHGGAAVKLRGVGIIGVVIAAERKGDGVDLIIARFQ